MTEAEITEVFQFLQLETEEKRRSMRFDSLANQRSIPIQVITTDSTFPQVTCEESRERA
jgi:hypothetical protein